MTTKTNTTSTNGKTAEEEKVETIRLDRLTKVVYEVPIRGTAPLIAHRWSEKAKRQLQESHTTDTAAQPKRQPKDPVEIFNGCRYRLTDTQDGFPASAFKAAIVHAARMFEGITQAALKGAVTVLGDGPDQLVPLVYDDDNPTMREDITRNSGRGSTVDTRWRPQYDPWSATLKIRVVKQQLDVKSLYALVDAAGLGGVGDWRPSSPKSATGSYGTWEIDE